MPGSLSRPPFQLTFVRSSCGRPSAVDIASSLFVRIWTRHRGLRWRRRRRRAAPGAAWPTRPGPTSSARLSATALASSSNWMRPPGSREPPPQRNAWRRRRSSISWARVSGPPDYRPRVCVIDATPTDAVAHFTNGTIDLILSRGEVPRIGKRSCARTAPSSPGAALDGPTGAVRRSGRLDCDSGSRQGRPDTKMPRVSRSASVVTRLRGDRRRRCLARRYSAPSSQVHEEVRLVSLANRMSDSVRPATWAQISARAVSGVSEQRHRSD